MLGIWFKGVKIFQKSIYFSWIFKGSALLHINAIFLILLFLSETFQGSLIQRTQFHLTYQNWIFASWICSIIAICSVVATFSVLTFSLNRSFHILLNCAWFISIVAAAIAFLYHFVQMTMIPGLMEWISVKPSVHLIIYLNKWEVLLTQLITRVVPICFAISGFFYTVVMFWTQQFPKKLSWWSFAIWALLLFGVILLKQVSIHWLYAILVIFLYVPWLWKVGESLDQILPEAK